VMSVDVFLEYKYKYQDNRTFPSVLSQAQRPMRDLLVMERGSFLKWHLPLHKGCEKWG
jgi:hypothetical protein